MTISTLGRTKIKKNKRLLKKLPDSLEAHLNLGRLYFKEGDFDRSLEHLRSAEVRSRDDPSIRNLLGMACYHTGRYPEAREILTRLHLEETAEPESLAALSAMSVTENDLNRAIDYLRQALELAPQRSEFWNDLGALHYTEGEIVEGEDCFRKAIECNDSHPLPRENLVTLLMESNRTDEAEEEARRYIEFFPDDFRGFKQLGMIYEKIGRPEEAIHAFAHSRELAPDDLETSYHLGLCAMQVDDLEGALFHFRTCLEADPDHQAARERLTACYCKLEGAEKAYRTLQRSFREPRPETFSSGRTEKQNRTELSILLPAFNESEKILSNLRELKNTVLSLGRTFEIIVVDDGSDDDTYHIVELASRGMKEISVYRSRRNIGKGMALREAALQSAGEWIVFLDADLELPPQLIGEMMERMDRERADVVLGSKRHRESKIDYPLRRRFISNLYYLINRFLFGLPVKDTQTGIKLFRREVLEDILPRLIEKKYAFDLELIVNVHAQGYKIVEAPIRLRYSRKRGRIGLSALWRTGLDTLAVFYRLKVLHYYDRKRPELTRYPRCSIIIAFKEVGDHIKESLEKCLELDYPDYEILLFPDESWPVRLPGVRVFATGPVPPSAKRDLGAAKATGEILCFLDDDAYPHPDWLKRVVRNFNDPDVAAVGGPAETPPSDTIWQQLSGTIFSSILVSGAYAYRYLPMNYREVDDFPTCNLSVRKKDFEAVEGFDTRYWPGEDTLLCRKLTGDLKKKIVYDPEAEVFHHRRALFGPHLKQVKSYALHRGFFARKFPENSLKFTYFIPSLFVMFLLIGACLSPASPPLCRVYAGIVGIYFFTTTIPFLLSLRPLRILIGMIGVFLTHLTYGIYFLKGLCTRSLTQ